MADFTKWKSEKEGYLVSILNLANKPLSDEPENMWAQMREIEAKVGYLHFILAEANSFLDRAESQAVHDLNNADGKKGNTDTEKKIKIAAIVCEHREFRDKVAGLIEAVQGKVMAGQTRMRYLRELPRVEN